MGSDTEEKNRNLEDIYSRLNIEIRESIYEKESK